MKVGIIAAMKEELSLLIDFLEDCSETHSGGSTLYTGRLSHVDVVLLLCGIGKVNAAVGTTLLINKAKPDVLINTGVAGAFDDEINIGDIVISSEVRHHDVDATAFNYEFGQIPQMPAAYVADEDLVAIAESVELKDGKTRIYKGPILSGDSFIQDPKQVMRILDRFPHIMAAEMEGAAIAQTSYLFDIPFVLIRSISDKVKQAENKDMYQNCLKKAAENSVRVVLELIDKLKEKSSYGKNSQLYN